MCVEVHSHRNIPAADCLEGVKLLSLKLLIAWGANNCGM